MEQKRDIMFTDEEKELIIGCLEKDLIDLKTRERLLRDVIDELKKGELEKGHLPIILDSVMYDVSQRILAHYHTEETRKLSKIASKISETILQRR